MTYAEAVRTFEKAHEFNSQLFALCDRIEALQEAKQRLTSVYGVDRVKSSPIHENPAQIALERQDEERERLNELLSSGSEAMLEATRLTSRLKTPHGTILHLHYCLGWSLPRIAKSYGKSFSTIKRWKKEAFNELRDILP